MFDKEKVLRLGLTDRSMKGNGEMIVLGDKVFLRIKMAILTKGNG